MIKFPYDLREEYVHGRRFLELATHKIDSVDGLNAAASPGELKSGLIFCKSDFVKPLFRFENLTGKYVLITGRSDNPVDSAIYERKPGSILHWFGVNRDVNAGDVTAIPLGMESKDCQGRSWDIGVIENLFSGGERVKIHLCYCNISRTTNPKEREPVYQWAKQNEWIYTRDHDCEFNEFTQDVFRSQFVVSPPGNGIESIRTWEAIYTGSIPIVKKSLNDGVYTGCPVLLVDSYESVTKELLERTWKEYNAREWSYDGARWSYWHNLVMSKAKGL